MHYFITNELSQPLIIRGDEHHHLSRVLRLGVGDIVLVGDGRGDVVEAVIEAIDHGATRCRVLAVHARYNEPPVAITLLQGALKNPSKMDWVVEKGTELGMSSFVPLLSEHTVAQSVKTGRLRKLAEAATKQCLRGRIPDICDPLSFTEAVEVYASARVLMFHESAPLDATIETLALDERPLAVFIGPEGGFSEPEVDLLRSRGADILSLGPRRLRGETAALAVLARLNGKME
jgi:16S rRNA (uracil1498-N3)-methyltransferase